MKFIQESTNNFSLEPLNNRNQENLQFITPVSFQLQQINQESFTIKEQDLFDQIIHQSNNDSVLQKMIYFQISEIGQSFDYQKSQVPFKFNVVQQFDKSTQKYQNISQVSNKIKKISKKTQPKLKNFFQTFINAHFHEIENNFPQLLKQKWIDEMRKKRHMSRFDFVKIYKIKELKNMWKNFFRQKKLYRALMISKASLKNKLNYVKYIDRFEEAFNNQDFAKLT